MFFKSANKNNFQKLVQCESSGIYIYSPFCLGIYTEIELDSSATKIYHVLIDFKNYKYWNPSITNAQGKGEVDNTIQVEIQWPGLRKKLYTLRLIELIPDNIIRWRGKLGFPFLFSGDHAFIVKQAQDLSKTHLKQVELFTGLLVPFLYFFLKHNIYQGFILLNQALKEYLEKIAPH